MKQMKWALAVCLASTSLLSACGSSADPKENKSSTGKSEAGNKSETAPAAKTNVEFLYALAGANGGVVQTLVKKYNESQNKYNVKATFVPPDQRIEKITTSIAAGSPPDLYTAGPPDIAQLSGSKGLMSIDQLAKDKEKKVIREQFFESLRPVVMKDNEMWGVPISGGVAALYYNEDLFKQAGLTRAPESWEEIVEYAKKLTDPAKGQWGLLLPTKEVLFTNNLWAPFLWQAGGDYFTPDMKHAAFNSKPGVEALQLWVDLVQKHKVTPLQQMDENLITQTFATGKIGMFIGFPLWITQSKDFPFVTKTAVLPKREKAASYLGGWYLTIPAAGKNKDGAYDFMAWLLQPENSAAWNIGMGSLPTQQSTLDTKEYQDYVKKTPLVQPFSEMLKFAVAPPPTDSYTRVGTTISKAIVKAMYGKESPQQALDEAAQEVNKLLGGGK
ncbi:ABC transporter substrate-binding protein [Paenibacillus thalictri]|uniref:ABC transporter substrate-binding protein n=1 Tax=Paenibacillus thalictri TaxID=2527873 RepID=A0A4Q9DQY5_9BACL|nr:ABC transporter substrate-binding protein [Paenibacillus thalictri]TBL79014.1 ABC transporter substrate-binding protein [Paenibacillus thalictri]